MKKRSKFKTFLRVKVITIFSVFVLFVIALQTPYFKSKIVEAFTQILSDVTQSNVSVKSYEGFVPFSFSLNQVEFKQDEKIWLHVEKLHLNRSLLYFLFWKKKSLDLSLNHAHLFSLPTRDTTFKSFKWPQIPYYSLNTDLRFKNVEISKDVFDQVIPEKLYGKISLHLGQYGRAIHLKSHLQSDQLTDTSLKFNARGTQKKNQFHIDTSLIDSKKKLQTLYPNLNLSPIDLRASLVGAPDAYIAFFKPKFTTNQSFKGIIHITFMPSSENSPLWHELLNDEKLKVESRVIFDQKGLSLTPISIEGKTVNFTGLGFLNRNYEFEETQLSGAIDDLSFTQLFFDAPIEGKINAQVQLSGSSEHLKIQTKVNSEHLAYKKYVGYNNNLDLLLERYKAQFVGSYQVSSAINQTAFKSSGFYTYCNSNHFDMQDVYVEYGPNKLDASSIKKINNLFQSTLSFDLKKLSLLSPWIGQEIHGDISGKAIFDIDVGNNGLFQTLDMQAEGMLFQHPDFNFNQYTFSTKGNLNLNHLKDFQGELLFSSLLSHYKNLDFTSVDGFIQSSQNTYQYKIHTQGELTLFSTGSVQREDQNYFAHVRQLSGHIASEHYHLNRPVYIEYKNKAITFSPLALKMGPGQVFLEHDENKDQLSINLKRFPAEAVTYFIPGFDVRGLISINGSLNHISNNCYGSLSARFAHLRVEDFQNKAPYHGTAKLTLNKKTALIDLNIAKSSTDYAQCNINIPLTLSLFPWSYKFRLDDSIQGDLTYNGLINPFIQLFIPRNHLVEGYADAKLSIEGSLKKTSVKGYANFSDIYYENLFIGLALKDATIQTKAKGQKLILNQLLAYDDHEGTVQATGIVDLNLKKHFPYQIEFDVDHAQVVQFNFLSATLFGKGRFDGNFKKAYLSGAFDITQAQIDLPQTFNPNVPDLPVTYLYPRKEFSIDPISRATKSVPVYFDVDLKAFDQTIIRGRGLNTSWSGNLAIRGSDENPKFKGKLESQEGNFDFAGRLFEITDGTIKFDGHIAKDTSINLTATKQISQYHVFINLKGPLQGPYLSYRSEPSMSNREVLSLVLFGQTVEELTPFQAIALTHTLIALGGVYQGPNVIDKLRKGIGLDQLSLGSLMHQNKDYTTIQLGKYISRSILITLNRPISAEPSPFVITAQFKGGFQFQTYFDKQALSKLQIQWRLSY